MENGKLTIDPLEEGTYESTESLARIALNIGLIFLMPFLVVSASMTMFETSQVRDTEGKFAFFSSVIIVPLLLVQLIGTWRKARAQIQMLRKANALTSRTRLDAIARREAPLERRARVHGRLVAQGEPLHANARPQAHTVAGQRPPVLDVSRGLTVARVDRVVSEEHALGEVEASIEDRFVAPA